MYPGNDEFEGVWKMRNWFQENENLSFEIKEEGRGKTYTEIPSSLIIYPIPYPSAATGPNPNSLKAGLPQLDVERMEVPRSAHPGSVYIEGIFVIKEADCVSCLFWS